jgi:hypothetical protein
LLIEDIRISACTLSPDRWSELLPLGLTKQDKRNTGCLCLHPDNSLGIIQYPGSRQNYCGNIQNPVEVPNVPCPNRFRFAGCAINYDRLLPYHFLFFIYGYLLILSDATEKASLINPTIN